MTLRVDFTGQDFFREPAAAVERLRAAGPVVEARLPIFGRVWMTTTQEMASRVLKDKRVFTLRKDDGTVAGLRWWMPNIFRAFAKSMLSVDEPDHTRLRGIVEEAFRRRAVLDMEPRIRAIAHELAGNLFSQGSPADLVTRYARVLPLSVICELLGLPLADRPKFMAWAARATSASSALVFFSHGANSGRDQTLLGTAFRACPKGWWRGFDRGTCPGRKGRRTNNARRDGSDGVSALIRGSRDYYASHKWIGF